MLAVAAPLRAEQASLREFGPADGLESLGVRAAVQDAEGFLWVGTENGLYRFDGVHFRRIGAGQGLSWINALAPQADGLWVGTDEGLWRWHRGKLVSVPLADGKPLAILGPGALAPAHDGSLWVAAKSGLHKVTPLAHGAGWHAARAQADDAGQPELQDVDGLVALPDGKLWFGCKKALCRLRDGRVERFGTERGVPASPWDWLIRGSDGSLWARGGQHLLQLAPDADRFVQHAGAGFGSDEAGHYPLVEDAQGRILTATRGALLRWDGQHWERFGVASGLTFPGRLAALVSDREGGLWLGATGAGLMQWRGYGQWENWSERDGLPSDIVWRFVRAGPDAGQPLYAGTGKGVAVLDPHARRFRALASNASGTVDIVALAVDAQGSLWAGTWGGQVVRYAGSPVGRGKVEAAIGEGEAVMGLLPDAPLEPLIVGLHQLYSWQPGRVGNPPRRMDEAVVGKGGFGLACGGRDGRLWVGGSWGLRGQREGRWASVDTGDGGVSSLACLHDGGLLVTSGYNGIHRLKPEGDRFQRTNVTPPLLQGRQVMALLEDRRGWWWVTTDAGVAVFNGQHWRWLDQQAGLIWSDTSGGGLYEDIDGSIWVGTSRGASHMLAPDALFEPIRGKVRLEEVRSGALTLPLPAGENSLSFPWTHDAIEVPLSAPVYRMRSAMRIEYRVTGFDDRWAAAPADAVRLTGLPPGAYRFEARLVDRELGVASPVSGFGFEIEPPWWRTPQAYAVAVLGVFVAGWLAHRWQVRRVTRHAAALEVLVRRRTQELEASREQLLELATRDALTGAWNRRAVMDILERELGRAQRERLPLTLLMADIDHFKRINDSFGHPAGDAVLCEFVKRLTATVRPYDAVGRFGGEEFLIVLPGLDAANPADALRVQALHAVISAEPMPQAGRVTCSVGAITLKPGMEVNADQFVALADAALYRAKRNGRDQVAWA
ncbi:diguanylate cyclase [Roseateles sp.]|uniref:ligand-binding sensor domain-containing diguanylate cyclase n=1 Tax=Roseateles sp. TaxID=1971397 RepID=UPI0032657F99